MTVKLDIVTAEQLVFSDDVDIVVAPGVDGELAVLPHHAPLMTMLKPGELRVRKGGEEMFMAITGGFLEVRPDRVTVLADSGDSFCRHLGVGVDQPVGRDHRRDGLPGRLAADVRPDCLRRLVAEHIQPF